MTFEQILPELRKGKSAKHPNLPMNIFIHPQHNRLAYWSGFKTRQEYESRFDKIDKLTGVLLDSLLDDQWEVLE